MRFNAAQDARALSLLKTLPAGESRALDHAADAWPGPAVMIDDLLRQAPAARPVLDRYGLRGCGGPLGPRESLEFFARAHDVPLAGLLAELRAAMAAEKDGCESLTEPVANMADGIYRPFFRAGIGVVLTLGAAWGVWLLVRIAIAGKLSAASLHEVNAHGHAQIFGWVGLFVMGFGYQAFARFKHADLAFPRLAYATLWMMLSGLVCRSLAEPLAAHAGWLGAVAVVASAIEAAAIALFALNCWVTLRGAPRGLEHFDFYILVALAWFVIQAVYETVYLAATLAAPDSEHLLQLVATWQGPLREIQIHGFAGLMILGVSQRMFHHFYGFHRPNARTSVVALVALNVALLGIVAGLVLMQRVQHLWALLWYAAVLVQAAATVILVTGWRIFSPAKDADRSLKYLRSAYVWLFISLAMTVLLPFHQRWLLPYLAPHSAAVQIGFSHAYYGAIRHAVTVGFVSLMIMGVAAKVVPTLAGFDVRRLSSLWTPLLLVNTGCAIRVSMQALTDFVPAAFPAAGVSGLLELTGLALWGGHLLRLMSVRAQQAAAAEALAGSRSMVDGERGVAVLTADSLVAEVLDREPRLLETFVCFGFRLLANPLLRHTLARRTTIAQACARMGVDQEAFLAALRNRSPGRSERGRSADGSTSGAASLVTISLPVLHPPGDRT